ncbi:hypothetical protein ACFW08_20045 [Streptomyces sp. NPDC058960]|uniref:hypothetical protein n=1 Tax=Streptomyces sp. NPDC058960 TaxID=3346679 RepID=UPI0036BD8DB3
MTLSPLARTASGVILAAWQQGRIARLSDQAAEALESAQLLQSPETAAELEKLRARVAELLAERHTTNEALDDAVKALRADRDRIAELEERLAGNRPVDEDPIAYALTDKAEEACDHPNGYGPYGCAGCGAFRPADDEDDVRPQVRKLRALLAGQRTQTGGA